MEVEDDLFTEDKIEDAPPPAAPNVEALTCHLAPHASSVHLDSAPDGTWVLTNDATLERTSLGPGPWQLMFDADGFGCAVQTETGREVLIEDVMKKKLFVADTDKTLWVRQAMGNAVQTWSLTERMRRYRSGGASWPYGLTHTATFKFCVVEFPRGGCRIYWNLVELYRQCGLNTFKGVPSKWVWTTMASWKQALADLGFHQAFLLSPSAEKIETALTSTTHFLPFSATSTLGLCFLFVRFLHESPQRGGLRDNEQRGSAKSLFVGFLKAICSGHDDSTWSIPVVMNYTWAPAWPRPDTHAPDLRLQVTPEGVVDLTEWRIAVAPLARHSHHPLRRWFCLVEGFGPTCHILDLLCAAGHAKSQARAGPLFSQLLQRVSGRAESLLQRVIKMSESRPSLGAWFDDLESSLSTSRDVDIMLIRHVMSAQRAIGDDQHIGITTDKASVKGLSLMNSVIIRTNNDAAVCPPQAIHNGSGMMLKVVWGGRGFKGKICLWVVYTSLWWCIHPGVAFRIAIHRQWSFY